MNEKHKFKSSQFYKVKFADKEIRFDYFGEYETTDAEEVKALKALAPQYIKVLECPCKDEVQEEVKEEAVVEEVPAEEVSPVEEVKVEEVAEEKPKKKSSTK
jgi:hypothetical protein